MQATLGFEVSMPLGIEAAIDRVTGALKTEGFGVLTRIDVQATLKERLGVEFRPYVILGACHPPTAHRALTANPLVGLMLPCNVTVECPPEGGTLVRLVNPEAMMSIGGMEYDPVMMDVAGEAKERLVRVAEALRKPA